MQWASGCHSVAFIEVLSPEVKWRANHTPPEISDSFGTSRTYNPRSATAFTIVNVNIRLHLPGSSRMLQLLSALV
jgi:hypothetical protein